MTASLRKKKLGPPYVSILLRRAVSPSTLTISGT